MTLPAIDDISSVGGLISDYRAVPDPTVERSAAQDNQIAANGIMATRTITRAFVAFTGGATPALVEHDALWGTGSGVAPVVAHVGTGHYTITWPATVTDALGVAQSINLRRAWASYESATDYMLPSAIRTAPNVVTVYVQAGGPPALSDIGATFNVFVV